MAARGYPGSYAKHTPINGLDRAAAMPGVTAFHAGTDIRDGQLVSAGGRVLTIVGTAPDLRAARDAAYAAVGAIDWPEGFCRQDIGWRAL
jgi:phosphoribosylamine--glycine ligase